MVIRIRRPLASFRNVAVVAVAERNVLNDVNGVVGGGNYTYFMLKYEVRNFL